MKLLDLFRLDLDAPLRDDEVIYTPLQMTRVLRFVKRGVVIIAVLGVLLLAANSGYTAFNAVTGAHRDATVSAIAKKADETATAAKATARELKALVAADEHERATRTVSACHQYNAQALKLIDAASSAAAKAAQRDAEQLIAIADQQASKTGKARTSPEVATQYIESQRAAAESGTREEYTAKYTLRDCTPEGIAAFYLNQPAAVETTTTCVGNGKGYCQ